MVTLRRVVALVIALVGASLITLRIVEPLLGWIRVPRGLRILLWSTWLIEPLITLWQRMWVLNCGDFVAHLRLLAKKFTFGSANADH